MENSVNVMKRCRLILTFTLSCFRVWFPLLYFHPMLAVIWRDWCWLPAASL